MQAYILIKGAEGEVRSSIVESLLADDFEIDIDKTFSYGVCVMHRNSLTVVLTSVIGPNQESQGFETPEPAHDASCIVVGDGSVSDVVNALLNGADVYLREPVNYRELLSRIRALCRRIESGQTEEVERGTRPSLQELLPSGTWKSLTDTETRLLTYLVARKERLVAHEELMKAVWGTEVDKGRLRYYVHSLRKKLTEDTTLRLKTHSGFGYLLIDLKHPVNMS